MALLTAQSPSQAGVAPTYSAVNATDTWVNSGREYLHVKNQNAGTVTVTITSVAQCNQGSTHNVVVSIPTGVERLIGPFAPSRFSDDANGGIATVTYSPTSSVTAALIRV